MTHRISQQLAFLVEADKLKSITRANVLADGSRFENTAEHSWHVCLWALVFADQSHGADITRVIQMLLLHDIVEIDAGDHPVHLPHNADEVRRAEEAAASRIFGLLPDDQAAVYRQLWDEFEANQSVDARFAKRIDKAAPMFLELSNPVQTASEHDILRAILETGRFADLHDDWPDLYQHAANLSNKRGIAPTDPLGARLRFVIEADALKSILRGTTICDGTRRENSGEHSWHIMLWAMTLHEHSHAAADLGAVLRMLLLHDIVEIDAGDNPLHGDFDAELVEAQEQAAADRLFGLLPDDQTEAYRAIWDEFEAAASDDAIFAKSLDRAQPLVCNLQSGGGSWIAYNVSRSQIDDRVGWKVAKGAPALWDALSPKIDAWFTANTLAD